MTGSPKNFSAAQRWRPPLPGRESQHAAPEGFALGFEEPDTGHCGCGAAIVQPRTGRPRKFCLECSPQRKTHRKRDDSRDSATNTRRDSRMTVKIRDLIAAEEAVEQAEEQFRRLNNNPDEWSAWGVALGGRTEGCPDGYAAPAAQPAPATAARRYTLRPGARTPARMSRSTVATCTARVRAASSRVTRSVTGPPTAELLKKFCGDPVNL